MALFLASGPANPWFRPEAKPPAKPPPVVAFADAFEAAIAPACAASALQVLIASARDTPEFS